MPVKAPGKKEPEGDLKKVWDAIDGEASVLELGRRTELTLFDVTQSLFQLCSTGHVQIRAPKPTDPLAICHTFNAAMRLVLKAVESKGSAPELRETLAAFASSSGMYDALFMFAGPEPDGAIKAERVVTNIASLAGDDLVSSLSQWLYDYAAFALFAASSLVDKETEASLSRSVGDMIGGLRQNRDEPASSTRIPHFQIDID